MLGTPESVETPKLVAPTRTQVWLKIETQMKEEEGQQQGKKKRANQDEEEGKKQQRREKEEKTKEEKSGNRLKPKLESAPKMVLKIETLINQKEGKNSHRRREALSRK